MRLSKEVQNELLTAVEELRPMQDKLTIWVQEVFVPEHRYQVNITRETS